MRKENSGAVALITQMVESLPEGKVESIKIKKNGEAFVKFKYKREIIRVDVKSNIDFNTL